MFKFKNKKIIIALILLPSCFIVPQITDAAGLIPCATTENPAPCTLCHFITGFKTLIDYGFTIITILAIVALFFAGVMYIVSSGDETMMTKAKGFIKTTLYGFAIVFLGWLIVDVTMYALAAKKATDEGGVLGIHIVSWNKFTCDTASTAPVNTINK